VRATLTAAFALALFALTAGTVPVEPVVEVGLVTLLVVATAIVTSWRWPVVTAACLFLANHAMALWATDAPMDVLGATGFGLALLFLLQSAHLGRGFRQASVDGRVVRFHLIRAATLVTITLAATAVGMGFAGSLSAVLPPAAAPALAVAGALGVVTALALALVSAARRGRTPA
jgi:hypothetical protein